MQFNPSIQGTISSLATSLYSNKNLVGALFLGGLAGFIIHKVNEEIREIKDYHGLNKFEFRILSHLSPTISENDGVKAALVRVEKKYPEEYKKLLKQNNISSDEELVVYYKKELSKGCCYGTVNALFDKICRGASSSFAESICVIQDEDLFYHQILQDLLPLKNSSLLDLYANMHVTEKKLKFYQQALQEQKFVSGLPGFDSDHELEITKNDLNNRIKDIGRHDHARTFSDSEKFKIQAGPGVYREALEKAMSTFPEDENIVGVVHLPKHVIGFQYGPRGYFLYDTFDYNKGLFEYFDSDTFFSELREHVIYDVHHHKQGIIEKEKLDTTPEELLKKIKPYFSIRPLQQINLSLEARELPEVTRELSEGTGAFIARKFSNCIHSLALTILK